MQPCHLKSPPDSIFLSKYLTIMAQVVHWVDYSSTCGYFYQLWNGTVGGLFNDSTKLILDQEQGFTYFERKPHSEKRPQRKSYKWIDCPKDLNHKLEIVKRLDINLNSNGLKSKERQSVYLVKCKVTRFAKGFRLSNGIVQVDYQDDSKLVVNMKKKQIGLESSQGYTESTSIDKAADVLSIHKRLLLSKAMLKDLLKGPEWKLIYDPVK